MASLLAGAFDRLRTGVSYVAGAQLTDVARRLILSVLDRIQFGQLVIEEKGSTTICGPRNLAVGSPPLPATVLRIKQDAFWTRVALFADMGFAESYMLGEFDCPDLTAFFRIFILNRDALSNGTSWTSSISNSISGFLAPLNSLTNSALNISAHYDLSNEMFAAFLSKDMTYSCPIWQTHRQASGDKALAGETLYDAQMRKLDHIADQVKIKPTDHVLEIGTGWGSFAMRAVERFGCRVTSLTLSKEQKHLAEQRIREVGMSEKIDVQMCDYRKHQKEGGGRYDKIISIEMLEAVGRDYLGTYFNCVDRLLKSDGGIAVFQCITIPEARYEAYSKSDDFIRKYIFPGGHLPSVTQLVNSIASGSKGSLIVDTVTNIGPHYARTLRTWKENFLENFELFEKELKGDSEVFKRKWEYYFTYCEAAFNTKTLGDHIITVSREGALEQLEGIPL